MLQKVDLEATIYEKRDLENFIFSNEDLFIRKEETLNFQVGSKVLVLSGNDSQLLDFYETLEMCSSRLAMLSSGTTKSSKTKVYRDKNSILAELNSLKGFLREELLNRDAFIFVTLNHSFGLIPAFLLSRQHAKSVLIYPGASPLEKLGAFFRNKPQIIFATPSHLFLIKNYAMRRNMDLSFLKTIVYAGAPLLKETITFFQSHKVKLISIYGTTQTGVIAVKVDVEANSPRSCGVGLPHLKVTLSKEGEVIVQDSYYSDFYTGDLAQVEEGELIFKRRKDSIVFKNANKLDLNLIETNLSKVLDCKVIALELEKNIDGASKLICTLPKEYEVKLREKFLLLIKRLPAYALPDHFRYE